MSRPFIPYHSHAKIITRGKGHNAVKAAAYRAGAKLQFEGTRHREAETFDYSSRVGIEDSFIVAPAGAPAWARDPGTLWNTVERTASRGRKDAQLSREFEMSLPYELPRHLWRVAAEQHARQLFASDGMVAHVSIHRYGARLWADKDGQPVEGARDLFDEWRDTARLPFLEADQAEKATGAHVRVERDRDGRVVGWRRYNPHAHFQLTMNELTDTGLGRKVERWDDAAFKKAKGDKTPYSVTADETSLVMRSRAAWAARLNAMLEEQGSAGRVDHRSYKAQGIARLPGKHLGRGYHTAVRRPYALPDRHVQNVAIRAINRAMAAEAHHGLPLPELAHRRALERGDAPGAFERGANPYRHRPPPHAVGRSHGFYDAERAAWDWLRHGEHDGGGHGR